MVVSPHIICSKKGENSFENLNKKDVEYFYKLFPDFLLIPNLYEQWKTNPTSN